MSNKKLGFGLMRLPLLDVNDKGSIDIEHTKKMVDEFIARGFTYFDTAWMYCGGKSEDAVNEVLKAGTLSEKINIDCWITMPGGASRVVNIMNYSDRSLEEPDYVALQRLCISGREESIYTEPLTYIGLVDIRKLEISSRIQKKAETNKIDWYAYWPDLESVEVLSE